MAIRAVIIDNREPEWIKKLTFGGALVSHDILDAGDFWIATDDNKMLIIERKTPNDFLGTLRDDRLFMQMARMQELRSQGYWPYLIISGDMQRGANGHVITDRETGWSWNAVEGALLSIQEMGIFVTRCAGDTDMEDAIMRLSERSRTEKVIIPPARIGKILGSQAGLLCSLPGIGPEKVGEILNYCQSPAWALVELSDMESNVPGIGKGIKNNVRFALGLKDHQSLEIVLDEHGNEVFQIFEIEGA